MIDAIGPAFDPTHHDRLLIPSTYVAHSGWTLEHFATVVEKARNERAVVLQFHGVPDPINAKLSVTPERFREFMEFLERGGYHCIAMRDLLPYLEELPPPCDATSFVRYPR